MKLVIQSIAAASCAMFPVFVLGQCQDGVCRLPAASAWPERGTLGLSLPADRDRAFAKHQDGQPQWDCRDGVCRIRPEQLSDCPDCDCDGKYCTCGPECRSHYQSRHGLVGDEFAADRRSLQRPATEGVLDRRSLYRPGDARLAAPRPLEDPFRRPAPQQVSWMTNYEHAIAQSRRTGRPMLIRVSASWCQYCDRMKAETYADHDVIRDIRNGYVPVTLDGDRDRRLIQALGVRTLPCVLVVTPDLKILEREEGFRTASQLTKLLGRYVRRAMRDTGYKLAAR